jgi:CubicO group peptidase (beta-lactamase class C family)
MKGIGFSKINRIWFQVLIACLLALNSCQSIHRKPKKESLESEIIVRFPIPNESDVRIKRRLTHQYFKEWMNPEYFSGQFLVAKNGHVIYFQKSGFADLKRHIPMTSSIPVHVASLSKVVTALAVLRLVDGRKIKLDADVRRYLNHFPYPGITIRMLLNHRSGIPYYGYFADQVWDVNKMLTNKDIIFLLRKNKIPLNFEQNTRFAYSNTNYAILALIIEKVTGLKFPDAMKMLVFNPLRMNHSFIVSGKKMMNCVSQSYNACGQLQAINYLDGIYGDKNLYTTALDLLKIDKGTYSNEFISDSLRKQMFKGYSYEHPGKSNYGLGIRMKEMKGKKTYFFHSGWWHGNTACYATLRSDSVCIIALSNKYSRNVYSINKLATQFGDYPF